MCSWGETAREDTDIRTFLPLTGKDRPVVYLAAIRRIVPTPPDPRCSLHFAAAALLHCQPHRAAPIPRALLASCGQGTVGSPPLILVNLIKLSAANSSCTLLGNQKPTRTPRNAARVPSLPLPLDSVLSLPPYCILLPLRSSAFLLTSFFYALPLTHTHALSLLTLASWHLPPLPSFFPPFAAS